MIKFAVNLDVLRVHGLLTEKDEPQSWDELFKLFSGNRSPQLIMYDYDENEYPDFYASLLLQVKKGCCGQLPFDQVDSSFENEESVNRVRVTTNSGNVLVKDFEREGPYIGDDFIDWLIEQVDANTDWSLLKIDLEEDTFTFLFVLPKEAVTEQVKASEAIRLAKKYVDHLLWSDYSALSQDDYDKAIEATLKAIQYGYTEIIDRYQATQTVPGRELEWAAIKCYPAIITRDCEAFDQLERALERKVTEEEFAELIRLSESLIAGQ